MNARRSRSAARAFACARACASGLVCALALAACSGVGQVHAASASLPLSSTEPLGRAELEALEKGPYWVARPLTFWHRGRKYVGALGYALVACDPERALSIAYQPDTLGEWVANDGIEFIAREPNDGYVVELIQGLRPLLITVPVRVMRRGRLARFGLATERPSGIEDLWGFLLAEPYGPGRTLLVSAVAIDLGTGILRDLAEKRVLESLLAAVPVLRGQVGSGGCWLPVELEEAMKADAAEASALPAE